MSSFLYPNSATRKLFGQSGKALERQNKRFLTIQQRLEREARDRELGINRAAEAKLLAEKLRAKKLIQRIVIGFILALAVLLSILLF